MSFLNDFVDWAASQLADDPAGSDYVRSRGIPLDLAERVRVGFSNAEFEVSPSDDPNHSDECRKDRQKRCDACRFDSWSHVWEPGEPAKYNLFNSVVFPLTTYSNQIVGIQVRNILEKSFDTFTIRRRPEPFLFGIGPNMDRIFSDKAVFVTEAPFDSLSLAACGFPNAIAVCTSGISGEQARTIRRFVRRVYTCFDNDAAGRKGAREYQERFGEELDIVNVIVPERYKRPDGNGKSIPIKDFNELQKHFGNDVVRRVIEEQL